MTSSKNELFQQALTAQKEGKFEVAESLYRSILEIEPANLDANNNLCTILLSLNRFDESAIYLKKIIQIKPYYAVSHYNLGNALTGLKRLDEAVISYKKAIDLNPNYAETHNNLGVIESSLGRFNESEMSCRKAIELKPDFLEAHYNLGNTLTNLKRLDEAVVSYKKVIEFKPNFPGTHYNLGNVLTSLKRLDEAVVSYKKAIELKPDYIEAYNNLGLVSLKHKKINEAEKSYKKALELNPNYLEAHDNLKLLLSLKKLLFKIDESKITENKNDINKISDNDLSSKIKETLNPFISSRTVEKELVNELYKIKATELNQMKTGPLFGNGKTSNFYLFDEDSSILKNLEKDLIKIMCQAVKSEVYIVDSFFNIMSDGGGSKFHTHVNESDIIYGISKKKYSLQYYLSVGDQNSSDSGVFEMKDPDEKILPTNGMITIIPADRHHSAIYSGKIDRIMIGVNFYSLI